MSLPAVHTWIDGLEASAVPALDRGLQYGDGHFTTLACRHGHLRFRAAHLARLRTACERLRIHFEAWSELEHDLDHAAQVAPPEAVVKVIITRGDALERGYAVTGHERARRIVSVWATRFPTTRERAAGIRALDGETPFGENPQLAGLKHLNRLESVVARHEWTLPNLGESLHSTVGGQLVCGTMSNVFLVAPDGSLRTPALDTAGVAGIARSLVLRECAKLRIRCDVAALPRAQLWEASGVFVTNVRLGVMPVTTLLSRNGRTLSLPVPPVVTQLSEHCEALDA